MNAIGIDLVEIDRIRATLDRFGQRFLTRILGRDELSAYGSRQDKAVFVAGRFAAKEAVIKCLGRFRSTRPKYAEIQITNDSDGNPLLNPSSDVRASIGKHDCLVSITHERNYAAAVAVITG